MLFHGLEGIQPNLKVGAVILPTLPPVRQLTETNEVSMLMVMMKTQTTRMFVHDLKRYTN